MMRQRKYRIFYGVDGQEKTYFHREFTFGEIENGCHWDEISDSPLLRDYSIIGKADWTGLKDKNGVEIYEGDIVQITFDWGYGPGSVYAEVVFEDAGYKFKSDAGCAYGTDGSSLVVGNIHENPELLEQGE